MHTSEIHPRWLGYFASKDHHVAPSVSFISPESSILPIVAGMVSFISYILGTEAAPWLRVASVQKCIRTNDIDNADKTTRHDTFFQMNGNFSFGDYLKEGAIDYAWELLTKPEVEGGYGLDGDRLWTTIWEKDEASFNHWTKTIGVDPERIQRLPFEEISWSTGQSEPAGVCCEIHYDHGPEYGPEGGPIVDVAGDRFLGIWNLVFDEFVRGEGEGHNFELVGKLGKTAIDTGAGPERLAFIMQDKPSMYEIDEVFPVIAAVQETSGKTYGFGAAGPNAGNAYEDDVRMRVIANHVRSALMFINNEVRPGNDGRGHMLRRLIYRAVRSMRLLGVEDATLPTLSTASKNVMSLSYPELNLSWDTIQDVTYAEEDAFCRTLNVGTTIPDTTVAQTKEKGTKILDGASAFAPHDTYGFPIDPTLEMAEEQGVAVDEDTFKTPMQEQKDHARADVRAKKTGHTDVHVFQDIKREMRGESLFLGHTESTLEATITGLLVDGMPVPALSAPAEVEVVLDRTPFYTKMDGQLADHGTIRLADGGIIEVHDVQAPLEGLSVHRGILTEGVAALGQKTRVQIDSERRLTIARAHTATHMVYGGLHKVLSQDTEQAGSENSPSRLRFDFRHSSASEQSQLSGLEALVNEKLAEDLPVTIEIVSTDEARKSGATALFGGEYSTEVHVVTIGDGFDKELCGGTHVASTGCIGRVALLGEASTDSDVRRIDAFVDEGAYSFQAKEHALVAQISALLGGRSEELSTRIEALLAHVKEPEKELDETRTKQALAQTATLAQVHESLNDIALVAKDAGELPSADALHGLAVEVRDWMGEAPAVIALTARVSDKPSIVVAANQRACDAKIKAGKIVRAVGSYLGGGGGNRDDVAQGGGTRLDVIAEALEAIRREVADS